MAFIGMRYPVVAKVATETPGTGITYTAGMVMGHAITGNLTITRNDNPLYGDDVIVEDDNGVTGMSLEMGLDDLTEDVRVYMLGLKVHGTGTNEWDETDEAAPYVGVGYIRVRRKNGATVYQAVWYHKVMFSEGSETSQTKGESIEWGTPTITGRVMGVYLDSTGNAHFRRKATFDTEAAAKTWLNTQAGIT